MLKAYKRLAFRFCTSVRERMEYDVAIVGGGIAGLSTAIKLKQQQQKYNRPISVCILEKGGEIGNHILSGNCFEPRGINELFPDWAIMDNRPPLDTPVTQDDFYLLLNQSKSIKVPKVLHPKSIDNHGNYIISLGKLCIWLSQRATDLGVDIFTGYPGVQVIYNDQGAVNGVITGDFGISKTGQKLQNYQPGIEIYAKQTVFAQGARGSLSQKVIKKFNLRKDKDPQIYGIGLKQIWEVPEKNLIPGKVQHTIGWPLPQNVYGGSFLYHMSPNQIHFGLVVGLDYNNPYLNPYEQFQRLKNHPQIQSQLQGGQCISYGSRVVNQGGYFAIPKLVFPGGVLVGCSAGFLNVMKIKGSHNAMKSGIEAGKAIYQSLTKNASAQQSLTVNEYEQNMKKSWTFEQMYKTRNFKNSFKNIYQGIMYSGFFKLFGGIQPFDIRNSKKDSQNWDTPAQQFEPIQYPKHDRVLTFDLLDNLARSGTTHQHNQPSHLKIKPGYEQSSYKSLNKFAGPEQRFCPAKVYEFVQDDQGNKKLQINAQNCLHCKTCSIKMVDEYIDWTTPQGSGGPQYNGM